MAERRVILFGENNYYEMQQLTLTLKNSILKTVIITPGKNTPRKRKTGATGVTAVGRVRQHYALLHDEPRHDITRYVKNKTNTLSQW